MADKIDAKTLRTAFLAGTKRLEAKQDWINELNVFPVPDGDTGTNMTLTLMNAVQDLNALDEDTDMDQVSKTIAAGTLRGARGNSGVILSQLIRGFAKEIEGIDEIGQKELAVAFSYGVKIAYKAVMKPKEGTMLTVSRAAAEKAEELKDEGLTLEEFLREILLYTGKVLEKTPEMLPVLKEAGVVDSGGQGLVEFLSGAYDAICGKEIDLTFAEMPRQSAKVTPVDSGNIETADIRFGYCTEFIINLEQKFGDAEEEGFKDFLVSLGDSIVCVSMDDIVKVHVHSNHPGEIIEKALTYGSLTNLKIDNMRFEHHEKVIREADRRQAEEQKKKAPAQIRKEVGFVAVCSGDGLAQIFKGMSVDEVIEGGQTMNPSTEDILAAVDRVAADHVFVLPNNKNIIMAANQAASLCKDKDVIVIPTKTVCQGINAVINYVPALSIEDNTEQLTGAAEEIRTAEITYAIRDTEIDGAKISKDDYMGIEDGRMLAVGRELQDVAVQTVKAMLDEDSELITVYYGADVSEEDAEEIASLLEPDLEDADIEVTYGGQPVYSYIISVE